MGLKFLYKLRNSLSGYRRPKKWLTTCQKNGNKKEKKSQIKDVKKVRNMSENGNKNVKENP